MVLGGVSPAFADESGQPAEVVVCRVATDADDGTEVNGRYWYPDGVDGDGRNRAGRYDGVSYDTALRFACTAILPGESFVYARLRLAGNGGEVDTAARLRVVGAAQDGVAPFDVIRPGLLPRTLAAAYWTLTAAWPDPGTDPSAHVPVHRYSPDIAAVINEITGRVGWGHGEYGQTLAVIVEDGATEDGGFVGIGDYKASVPAHAMVPRLELYRTVRSTFVAKELLGRPTDHSVALNALSLLTLQAYVQYGTSPTSLPLQSPVKTYPGGLPMKIVLDRLQPGTGYFYRLRYRQPGAPAYLAGPIRQFRTRRGPGRTFKFAVLADSHIWEALRQGTDTQLYTRTLGHVAADRPDFVIDLGDTMMCEDYSGGDVMDLQDAINRLLAHRAYFDLVCHSVPLFCVLGNHEGEQGWRLDGTPDNVAVWATQARQLLYPNPVPDGFYSGCDVESEFVGLPENYYAFEWGDALFVMLDPYRYTMSKPHGAGGTPGSGDNWDWTLGYEQYDWLRNTLGSSTATFKFVFCHQVVGGVDLYGRGGIEAASHALGGAGSFEWGGEDVMGGYVFDRKRPGWGVPIHQLLVENNVAIFFHGHDHCFAKEELDGVVYQECPRPSDRLYMPGLHPYPYADKVNNSGHLRVAVSPAQVVVEYVRAYLPGDGEDGEIGYAYTLQAAD